MPSCHCSRVLVPAWLQPETGIWVADPTFQPGIPYIASGYADLPRLTSVSDSLAVSRSQDPLQCIWRVLGWLSSQFANKKIIEAMPWSGRKRVESVVALRRHVDYVLSSSCIMSGRDAPRRKFARHMIDVCVGQKLSWSNVR
jgi:hypothetical protein